MREIGPGIGETRGSSSGDSGAPNTTQTRGETWRVHRNGDSVDGARAGAPPPVNVP